MKIQKIRKLKGKKVNNMAMKYEEKIVQEMMDFQQLENHQRNPPEI